MNFDEYLNEGIIDFASMIVAGGAKMIAGAWSFFTGIILLIVGLFKLLAIPIGFVISNPLLGLGLILIGILLVKYLKRKFKGKIGESLLYESGNKLAMDIREAKKEVAKDPLYKKLNKKNKDFLMLFIEKTAEHAEGGDSQKIKEIWSGLNKLEKEFTKASKQMTKNNARL